MINTKELAQELSNLTGKSTHVTRETWCFVTGPGITRIQDEYQIWFTSSKKLYNFVGPEAMLNFVKRKKILFRKF